MYGLTKTKSQKQRAKAQKQAMVQLRGSGAYDFRPMLRAMKPIVKQALVEGGGALGKFSGIPGMGPAGSEIGRRISRLIGSGDYQTNEVSVNNLIHPRGADPSANFGKDSLSIRMRHREFLGDIKTGSVAGTFVNYAYPINAGLRQTFPYLSQLASNFETYCCKGIVFEFISSASPYVSSGSLGTVIGSCEYNAAMPLFASKFAMENSNLSVSTRLDKNLMYGLECAAGANAQNCYYIREGTSSSPLNVTDMGIFQLGLAPGASVPANTVVGELWVAYDVELSRPLLELSRNGYATFTRDTVTGALPLGTNAVTAVTNGNLSNVAITGNSISIPDAVVGDVYLVTINMLYATPGAWTTYFTPTGTNCTLGIQRTAPTSGSTSARSIVYFTIQATDVNVSVTLSGAVFGGSGTSSAVTNIVSVGNFAAGFSLT